MDVQDFFDTFFFIERLERQPRSGWHQAGLRNPENVAAHTYGVAMVAMWLADYIGESGEDIDVEKVLRMALLHDIGEAITTDLPKPVKRNLRNVEGVEKDAEDRILNRAPHSWPDSLTLYNARECVESRIVKAADGLQMMLMALQYERESRLNLEEFFAGTASGFDIVDDIKARICALRSEK